VAETTVAAVLVVETDRGMQARRRPLRIRQMIKRHSSKEPIRVLSRRSRSVVLNMDATLVAELTTDMRPVLDAVREE
jgi:hypothetical protein